MNLEIAEFGPESLVAYETVGIGYQIASKVVLEDLISSRGSSIREEPTPPRWKDYDLSPQDRPTALPDLWDMSNWAIFGALRDEEWLGGCILARETPELDLLDGRFDLALIVDIRVRPDARGSGIGKVLFTTAIDWAKSKGCTELRVETQDVNVPACRFYSAMGLSLLSVEANAYGDLDEAKLIWNTLL